jgi:hypothetical protein
VIDRCGGHPDTAGLKRWHKRIIGSPCTRERQRTPPTAPRTRHVVQPKVRVHLWQPQVRRVELPDQVPCVQRTHTHPHTHLPRLLLSLHMSGWRRRTASAAAAVKLTVRQLLLLLLCGMVLGVPPWLPTTFGLREAHRCPCAGDSQSAAAGGSSAAGRLWMRPGCVPLAMQHVVVGVLLCQEVLVLRGVHTMRCCCCAGWAAGDKELVVSWRRR